MLDVLIDGRLHPWPTEVDGQLDLPRAPPFFDDAAPAALVTLEVNPEHPNAVNLVRMFKAWYLGGGSLHVVAGDLVRTWVSGRMRCVGMDVHEGIQSTRSVLPEVKWRMVDGLRLPYQDQPTFQRISRPVRRYVLAAWRYDFCARPARAPVKQLETVH